MPTVARILVFVLVLAAMWLVIARLATLGRDSLQYDEIQMLRVAGQPTDAAFEAAIPADAAPLGYHILRAWGVEGRSDAGLRVPAFLFGLLCILPLIGIIFYATPPNLKRWTPLLMAAGVLALLLLPPYNLFLHRLTPETAASFSILCTVLFALLWASSPHWGYAMAMAGASSFAILSAYAAAIPALGILIGCFAISPFSDKPDWRQTRRVQMLPLSLCIVMLLLWAMQRAGARDVASVAALLDETNDNSLALIAFIDVNWWVVEFSCTMLALSALYFFHKKIFVFFFYVVLVVLASQLPSFLPFMRSASLSYQIICLAPIFAIQPLILIYLIPCKQDNYRDEFGQLFKPRTRAEQFLILFLIFSVGVCRLATQDTLATQTTRYADSVKSLSSAPGNSLTFLPTIQAKSCYEFYKDKRFAGAPEARVFDPQSQYQAELMLSLDRVYIVDAGKTLGMAADEMKHDHTRQFQKLFNLANARARAGLSSLDVLKFFNVSPDIGPLPDDGIIPLGSGDGGGPFYIVRGFYKPEMWGDTEVRWAHPHARAAAVLSPGQAARFKTIRLKAFPWGGEEKDAPRTFELAVNGVPLGARTMPARSLSTVEWPLPALQPGLALITITTPDDVPQAPGDPRTLSLAIYEISFQE